MFSRTLAQMPAGASTPDAIAKCFPTQPNQSVATDPEYAGRNAAVERGLGCVRGLRYAIAFEATAALALYALWRLWLLL